MNTEQLNQFKTNYIEMIIEHMDMDGLCQLAYDALSDAYKDSSEKELKEEILDLYDDSVLNSIIAGNI